MENNRVSPIHLFLSTAIAALCVLWLWEQPNINIRIIIFIQFVAIFVSFFADVPLRKKLIQFISLKENKLDSLDGVKSYLKVMFIGTITIVSSFSLAVIFIDYKNNPDRLLFTVSVITVFLIWLVHNWSTAKIHNTKL